MQRPRSRLVLMQGQRNRHVAGHGLNDRSSRSHTIFTLWVQTCNAGAPSRSILALHAGQLLHSMLSAHTSGQLLLCHYQRAHCSHQRSVAIVPSLRCPSSSKVSWADCRGAVLLQQAQSGGPGRQRAVHKDWGGEQRGQGGHAHQQVPVVPGAGKLRNSCCVARAPLAHKRHVGMP